MNAEKVVYWRKRMHDKLKTTIDQVNINTEELLKMALHIGLDKKELNEKTKKLLELFAELDKEIDTAVVVLPEEKA